MTKAWRHRREAVTFRYYLVRHWQTAERRMCLYFAQLLLDEIKMVVKLVMRVTTAGALAR